MAVELQIFDDTLEAGADLSADQHKFVKLAADGQVVVCDAATDIPIGVLQNKPDAAGKAARVRVLGISKVQADADLSVGDQIGTSADGQAGAKVAGTDTTEFVVGTVRKDDADAAGELVTAYIDCMAPSRAA